MVSRNSLCGRRFRSNKRRSPRACAYGAAKAAESDIVRPRDAAAFAGSFTSRWKPFISLPLACLAMSPHFVKAMVRSDDLRQRRLCIAPRASEVMVAVVGQPNASTPRSYYSTSIWHFDFRHEFRDTRFPCCEFGAGYVDPSHQTNLFETQSLASPRSILPKRMICDRRLGKRLQSDGLAKTFQAALHARRYANLIRDRTR